MVALLVALGFAILGTILQRLQMAGPRILDLSATTIGAKVAFALAVLSVVVAAYLVVAGRFIDQVENKRRRHSVNSYARLAFGSAGVVAVLAVLTDQWIGLLYSLGILGFAITFALQQPLLSLLGWVYIMIKRPYGVGDRVKIEDSKGDVIDVDFLVTTLWEVNGELISSHQPSGRVITLPNSVVLSSQVYNYSWERFPNIWNELSIQVAFETDLDFATDLMVEVADDYLGEEMAANVDRYRDVLAETAVELEVHDRPSVNIHQQESWIDLRLRYLVHPRAGTRVRNELYKRILTRLNEHPDRVKFPVGRNR